MCPQSPTQKEIQTPERDVMVYQPRRVVLELGFWVEFERQEGFV